MRVGYPSASYVVGQHVPRIDDVGGLRAKMNVENADQSATEQEMIPMSPKVQIVRSLFETKCLPYLWFPYGICKKGPGKHRTIYL